MSNCDYQPGPLLKKPLAKNGKIAYICSPRLGDTLISLVTVDNLLSNGFSVDVYGDYAIQLASWFPHMTVFPATLCNSPEHFKNYDAIFHMYDSDFAKQLDSWHPNSIVFSRSPLYRAKMTMVDIQVQLCKDELKLSNTRRINSIKPLSHLVQRKYPRRVIIHPSSFLPKKNWPAKKFVKLANLLQAENYQVEFMLSPAELVDWQWLNEKGFSIRAFSSLSDAASFLFESGFFIGNDSGIGHLASNVGLPTLTIILRKSVAKQWRPSWSVGKIVLSPSWVNPRPVKEKLWKIFTTVGTVKKTFDQLVSDTRK